MTASIRFGIAGCGGIARSLVENGIMTAKETTLVACSDVVAENAREFADEYDVEVWYTDHVRMLDEIDLDIVIVATPDGAHANIVVDCAEAGVNVLCQKPLEITVPRIDRMIEACDANDVKLGGLYNLRFMYGSRATRYAVESGAVGDVVLANGICPPYRDDDFYDSWHGNADLSGGILLSFGIHLIDRLRMLNNGIEWVFADTDTAGHDIDVSDFAAVTIGYSNGARGTITVTTATKGYPHYDRIDLHGEEGYVISRGREILCYNGTGDLEFDAPEKEGFAYQVQDMAEAVRSDRDPIVTGREARQACDAALAMEESAKRGVPVRVDEFLSRVRSEDAGE